LTSACGQTFATGDVFGPFKLDQNYDWATQLSDACLRRTQARIEECRLKRAEVTADHQDATIGLPHGAWSDAIFDWIEEKKDRAVEEIATSADGKRLALEHTLIQPFVGEKFDSEAFIRAFGRIERNPALVVPERNLDIIIPVGAIPKGYNWEVVGQDLLTWLLANHQRAPREGEHAGRIQSGCKNTSCAEHCQSRCLDFQRPLQFQSLQIVRNCAGALLFLLSVRPAGHYC
jgi:hypothetical protein